MTDSIKLSPSALHEGDTELMEDKEMEQKIEELSKKYFDNNRGIAIGFKETLMEAYSLGQSHMKQKCEMSIPEKRNMEVILEEGMNLLGKQRVEDFRTGFNDCREQTLSALSEL